MGVPKWPIVPRDELKHVKTIATQPPVSVSIVRHHVFLHSQNVNTISILSHFPRIK